MSVFKDTALQKIEQNGGSMKLKHLVAHLMREFLIDIRESQKGLKLMRKQNLISIKNGTTVITVEE